MSSKHIAMAFDSTTRRFTQLEYHEPELRPGEIWVRVTCCTLCGSDLHTFSGRRSAPTGCVLGHEIIGEIVKWGGDTSPVDFRGKELQVGQRVTWAMAVGCGKCFFCRQGIGQKCETLFKYGHEPGGNRAPTGGLSEFCLLKPGTPVFRIPGELPDEVAAPANCATATVSAALRLVSQSHTLPGATAVIVGAGMLGLAAAAQLSEAGAAKIVISDPDVQRLSLAKSFGATHCIASSDEGEITEIVDSSTGGRGADVAFDFAGVNEAVKRCIRIVRTGGCVLLAGSVFPADPIPIEPQQIVRRMLTLRGLHNYLPEDLESGIEFLLRHHRRYPFAELVSKEFTLQESTEAFQYAQHHKPVRVVVKHPRP